MDQQPLPAQRILGVSVTNATKDKILEYILNSLENREKKLFITTPNPEILVYAIRHPEFRQVLNHAQIALCDGIGLKLSSLVLGKPLQERFSGTDFVKIFCEAVAEKPITVGFLGGRRGVAEKAAECLRQQYPELKIVFVGEEWPQNSSKLKHIDMLFVAYGFPKQEIWIYQNLDKIPVTAAIGVGGAFDYISGKVSRAPAIIRFFGLEWLYRLIRQPWRAKRQLALIEFMWLVLKARIAGDK